MEDKQKGLEEEILDEIDGDETKAESYQESDSGVFNLARMIAKSPAAKDTSYTSGREAAEDYTGPYETAVSDIPPAVVRPRRKYTLPIAIAAALLFVSAVVTVVIIQKSRKSAHEEAQRLQVALLEAQIEQFQAKPEPSTPEPVLGSRDETKKSEILKEETEVKEAESEAEAEVSEPKRDKPRNRVTRKVNRSTVAKPDRTIKDTKKSGEDELDKLLGVGSQNKTNRGGSSGSTDKTLSRTDVQAGMR